MADSRVEVMTPPRYIESGQLCFITARTVGRMFFLLPERAVVKLVGFIFALAVRTYGIRVHDVLFMSNHFHILATDVEGRLPDFMNYLNSLLARALNALRGRSGSVFEKHYNLVIATDDEAILQHATYTLANPCQAGLVRRSAQWVGFSSRRMTYGKSMTFARPKLGLWKKLLDVPVPGRTGQNVKRAQHRRNRSKLPETVEFTLHRPPVRGGVSDEGVREEVLQRLDAKEMELIRQRAKRGTSVIGMGKVLAQKWWSFPGSPDAMFKTTPHVSGRSKWARIEMLGQMKTFVGAYRRARARFLAGIRDVLWPRGTWLMRVRHGLPCEQGPP